MSNASAKGLSPANGCDQSVQRALVVARREVSARDSDARNFQELTGRLDAFSEGNAQCSQMTRESAIEVLTALRDVLSPALYQVIGEIEDGIPVVSDHPAVEQLTAIIDALQDLAKGKTHPALRPNPTGSNASLPTHERKKLDALLLTVSILSRSKKITITEAEAKISESLKKRGYLFRGKPVSKHRLRNLRINRSKRKHPK